MNAAITVTTPDQAETLWVIRDRMKFMGEVPGTGLTLLELEVPPGAGTPPHTHTSPEVFRVVSGEVIFGIFNTTPPHTLVAGPGTVVSIPSSAPHNYHNATSRPATLLVLVDQTMVDFFRDLGRREAPAGGPPSAEEIAAVVAACARHRITLLPGPTK